MAATIVGPTQAAPGLPGGLSAAFNLTSAQVIKAAPGVLVRIVPIVLGSGNLTFNDLAVNSGAGVTNEIFTAANTAMTVGVPILLEWPCATGITASSVPSDGQYAVSFS